MVATILVQSVPEFAGVDGRPVEGSTAYRLPFGVTKQPLRPDQAPTSTPGAPVYYSTTKAGSDPSWPYSLFSKFQAQLVLAGSNTNMVSWEIYNLQKVAVGDAVVNSALAWGTVVLSDPAKSLRKVLMVSDGNPTTPKYKATDVPAPTFLRASGTRVIIQFPDASVTYHVEVNLPRGATAPASLVIPDITVVKGTGITGGTTAPVMEVQGEEGLVQIEAVQESAELDEDANPDDQETLLRPEDRPDRVLTVDDVDELPDAGNRTEEPATEEPVPAETPTEEGSEAKTVPADGEESITLAPGETVEVSAEDEEETSSNGDGELVEMDWGPNEPTNKAELDALPLHEASWTGGQYVSIGNVRHYKYYWDGERWVSGIAP